MSVETRIKKQVKELEERIRDQGQEEPRSLEHELEKIRQEEYSSYEYKIETIIIPGQEQRWSELHNDINIDIYDEKNIENKMDSTLMVVLKYRIIKKKPELDDGE